MKVKVPILAIVPALLALPLLAREPSRIAPKDAPASAEVAPSAEPGERLEVSGVVYAAARRTPGAAAFWPPGAAPASAGRPPSRRRRAAGRSLSAPPKPRPTCRPAPR